MGSNSQRKKERLAKRRKEKRKRQDEWRARQQEYDRRAEAAVGSNARHRQRLSQQIPHAWPGEAPEDVAIFDDTVLSQLPPDLAEQAAAVREALRETLESRGDDGVKRVATISRTSPFSEWRLFIRGLNDWLADDRTAAGEAWQRLNPERRPGRIAMTMMVALRTDLDQAVPFEQSVTQNASGDAAPASGWNRYDAQQLYHAKLLRRVRFERSALKVAESGVNIPEEGKDLHIGFRKISWLNEFIKEYRDTEPELVAALAHTALGRAFAQYYSNIFDEAVKVVPGPRHDPRNRLLTFHYYSRFGKDPLAERTAELALDEYLKRDLPKNEALSEPLRGAILSQIHLNEAAVMMAPPSGGSMFEMMFAATEDTKAVRKHLQAAVKAAPANGKAHKAHVAWIQSKLDNDRLEKSARTKLENELVEVMRGWSQGQPDEVAPRLWLVDHLLENELLDEARPHVDFLAGARHDNPRARASPWKWQILEAMRLCRRKAWLADVPARLDEAETLWPTWLPKDWLPYLRAALALRAGKTDEFEESRRQIGQETGRSRDSLADACMMLGAAQQMRASSAELKTLRAAVEAALKQIKELPLDDLLMTASFFWDLHRAQLLYPAYRLQTKAIGKELIHRLDSSSELVVNGVNDARFQKAILWGSEFRFWSNNYETTFPKYFSNPPVQRHPLFVAAKVNAFLKQRVHWRYENYADCGLMLREAAASERDPYYRHWFLDLANQLDDIVDKQSKRLSGFPFGNLFGNSKDDDGDDDGDGDDDDSALDFDPDCNCPECRAARQEYERIKASKSK